MIAYLVNKKIDYLAFTTSQESLNHTDTYLEEIRSPLSNYNMCVRHMSGMLHCWHTFRPEMNHHYIMAGECLDVKRSLGFQPREFIAWAQKHGHFTRIDIAITSYRDDYATHELTADDIVGLIMRNELKSRLKPAKEIAMNKMTETKYIGNPEKRHRLFRAYDKGLPLGKAANRIIRYELETRRGTKALARQIANGADYGALMRRYVDFPQNETWVNIMGADSHEMTIEPRRDAFEAKVDKNLSRWNWLVGSVAKTVAKALIDDYEIAGIPLDDNGNMDSFMQAIATQILEYKHRNAK